MSSQRKFATTYVIAIASWKGGVGKSTLTVSLAHELSRRDIATAVVDLDINGHAALSLTKGGTDGIPIQVSHMSDVASKNPAGVTQQIGALSRTHDVILIDTPGAIEAKGAQVALLVATAVLMPFKPGPYELESTVKTMDLIDNIRVAQNPNLKSFLLLNQPARTVLSRDVNEALNDELEARNGNHKLLDTVIRSSVSFGEMAATGIPLWKLGSSAKKPASEIALLADELLSHLA